MSDCGLETSSTNDADDSLLEKWISQYAKGLLAQREYMPGPGDARQYWLGARSGSLLRTTSPVNAILFHSNHNVQDTQGQK